MESSPDRYDDWFETEHSSSPWESDLDEDANELDIDTSFVDEESY